MAAIACASSAVLAGQCAAQGSTGIQAGVAAAVRGEVRLVSFRTPEAVGRNVTSGDAVYLGDRVESGNSAGLQIMLLDETIFTIGPDSAIVIDRFVYDPDKGAGKVSAQVVRGVFRFVSGRVAANKPSDMEVRLPNGVIGIRGTSAAGIVRDGVSEVVLLGPGPDNNVGEPGGRIIVSGPGGEVEISRPNFGTVLSGAAPPAPPVRWTPAQLNGLTGTLRAAPPSSDGAPSEGASPAPGRRASAPGGPAIQGGGSALRAAGQDIGAASGISGLIASVTSAETALTTQSESAAEEAKTVLGGITTLSQLSQITNGTFDYGTKHVQFTANSSYDFSYSIDFNARTHSGSVVVNTSTADGFAANASGTFALLHDIFSNSGESLSIREGGPGTIVPGLNSNNNQITVNYKFINDGSIATRIEHSVEYQEPAGGTTVQGSGYNDR